MSVFFEAFSVMSNLDILILILSNNLFFFFLGKRSFPKSLKQKLQIFFCPNKNIYCTSTDYSYQKYYYFPQNLIFWLSLTWYTDWSGSVEELLSLVNLPLILNIMEICIFLCLTTLLLGLKHEGLTAPLPSQLATGFPNHREPSRTKGIFFPLSFSSASSHCPSLLSMPWGQCVRSPLLPGPRWGYTEAGWPSGEALTSMPRTQEVLVISRINTELKSMNRSKT